MGVATGLLGMVLVLEPVGAEAADRARIQAHLWGVEQGLRARAVDHLTPDQQQARAAALDELHRYWTAGVFPRNTGHPGAQHPYFIDDGGRSCAVAHLMLELGGSELARRVSKDHNIDYVADMRTPGILEWASAHGLTALELGRIQPGYCSCEGDEDLDPVCGEDGVLYWNACIANLCADVEVVASCDAGETCGDMYVNGCGFGISQSLCNPKGGGGAEPVMKHVYLERLDAGDCETRGCACATQPRAAPLWLWWLLPIFMRRAFYDPHHRT